jgi:hypothetical protein
MSTFDEREKAFEHKYQHDQELQFKTNSRRNKLLGLWAAGQMGKTGDAAESYAKEIVMADFEKPGHDDVIERLVRDFAAAGKPTEARAISKESERLMTEARRQIMTELKD